MLKRTIDIIVSTLALVLLAPLMALVAIAVRLFLGAPVLFRQQRPGLHEVPFAMVKFRSMLDTRDADGNLLPDDERQTRFGRFLRSSSLDELPELWNVLRGEMSLIGPRPLLVHYLDHYTADQRRRHEVRPGITGWAQVHGRADLEWEEKLAYDLWYVDHAGLWLDLKIVAMTIGVVLGRHGTHATHHGLPPTMQTASGESP